MADDTQASSSAEDTSTEDTTTTEDTQVDEIARQAKDPDAVTAAIRSERASAREARKKAEAAEAKVRQFEDRDKTAQEKAEAKAKDAEERATAAEQKALRLEVGGEKSLPTEIAALLQGSTKEEMEEHADRLSKVVTAERTTSFDGGARSSATGSDDMNAKIRAAAGY